MASVTNQRSDLFPLLIFWWARLNRKLSAWVQEAQALSFRNRLFADYLEYCSTSAFFVSWREAVCLCAHAQALVPAQRGGREAKAPALLHPRNEKGGGDYNDFNCGSTPPKDRSDGQWRGGDVALIFCRAELIFKVKEKESRVPLLPLVVDSPKHWVWRGFWSLEFDARLIHRLLRVCTRWPRVNEHKLIPFAHQGNVQLNLICTLQLKIFEYF